MTETKLLPVLSVTFMKLVFMKQTPRLGVWISLGVQKGTCTWCHKPASYSKISFTCYTLKHHQGSHFNYSACWGPMYYTGGGKQHFFDPRMAMLGQLCL